MAEWSFPQIIDDGVNMDVNGFSVDVSEVSLPNDVEVLEDAPEIGTMQFTVSGGDFIGVSMSVEDFKELVLGLETPDQEDDEVFYSDVSGDDSVYQVMPLSDVSTASFTPQTWQLNMAQNRPIGWHYLMTRLNSNNQYILVLGRDIVYSNGIYNYSSCDYYTVYSITSSGTTRFYYDVLSDASGTVNSSSYVVYSDLFFDYLGGRSVSYSWLIIVFILLGILFLMYIRGKRK